MPDAVLSEILLHVVLEEGDAALLNLSLVCSKFRSLVDTDSFRKRAHFCWLDSMYFLLHIWLKMFKIAPYHSISQLLCLNVYLCNNAFFLCCSFQYTGVTKWRTKSEPCQEFFKMYTLQPCRHCNEVYKNCLPGVYIMHENVITAR